MILSVRTDDGVALHAEVEGREDAPALLLSNSLGTRLEMWDAQARALTGRFRVIRYDSRGHGRSAVPEDSYTIERLGRDALAVLDAVGVRSTRFCGLSKGGMVGIWLGAHAADRIERLVLANTAAALGPPQMWDARIDAVLKSGMTAVAEAVIERWFTPAFRARRPDAVEVIRAALRATPPLGYAGCCRAIRDMDLGPLLGRIDAPTLVIGGAHDPATPLEKSHEISRGIRGSSLTVLDAAHLSNVEQAERFTAALSDFLA